MKNQEDRQRSNLVYIVGLVAALVGGTSGAGFALVPAKPSPESMTRELAISEHTRLKERCDAQGERFQQAIENIDKRFDRLEAMIRGLK